MSMDARLRDRRVRHGNRANQAMTVMHSATQEAYRSRTSLEILCIDVVVSKEVIKKRHTSAARTLQQTLGLEAGWHREW